MRLTAIALALMLGYPHCAKGDALLTETLGVELLLKHSSVPSGGFRWNYEAIDFPTGCKYVSHDIQVIEMVPEESALFMPEQSAAKDRLIRDRTGRVTGVIVVIAGHRPLSLPPGPVSTSIRVNLVVKCEPLSLQTLIESLRTLNSN
jgi:hypothetical protein